MTAIGGKLPGRSSAQSGHWRTNAVAQLCAVKLAVLAAIFSVVMATIFICPIWA